MRAPTVKQPTEDQVDALANAMCMVLNELAHGDTVGPLVKAHARVAMEPFLLDDNGDLPDLEWAQKVVDDDADFAFDKRDN